MPPVESLGYRLQGTVRSGDTLWAIVAHPTGQRILRPGDSLAEGLVVDAITEEGLWLQSGESRALLKFPAPGSP